VQAALCVRKGQTAVIVHVFGGNKPAGDYQSREKAIAALLVPAI
jgi:hypothetical protein